MNTLTKPNTSIPPENLKKITDKLLTANNEYLKIFPGETPFRQPVHTVYGGAHLFKSGTTAKIGELALASLKTYAPGPAQLASALGFSKALTSEFSEIIYHRVLEKLKREAVEDFRIDFEDGYGNRPDAEEDATAVQAASEVALAMQANSLSPFVGIRIKTLSEEMKVRGLRTLDLFLTALLEKSGGKLPSGFVVTLPKIVNVDQVTALIEAFEALEQACKLKSGTLKMELMIETPQSVFDAKGSCALPAFIEAALGRCVAAHFGTYDYTASMNITADNQVMDHPACDFARQVMKVCLAGTGVWLSDGATNVMPIGDPETVHRAWKLSYQHIQHSLKNAYYQGWDLHPAQLPVRYAALSAFFLTGLKPASARLKNFIEQAAKATLVGDIFDDAATGQGLLNYFLRAMNCGAITEQEVLATGLTLEEVRSRSFKKILEGRKL